MACVVQEEVPTDTLAPAAAGVSNNRRKFSTGNGPPIDNLGTLDSDPGRLPPMAPQPQGFLEKPPGAVAFTLHFRPHDINHRAVLGLLDADIHDSCIRKLDLASQ